MSGFIDKPEELRANAGLTDGLAGGKNMPLLTYHGLEYDKDGGLGRDYGMKETARPGGVKMQTVARLVRENTSLECRIGG